MVYFAYSRLRVRFNRIRTLALNLRRDQKGTTAIEFAMVSTPFFLLAFSILGIGLQYFTINALEHGVEAASRKIRTGQAQSGMILAGQTEPTTLGNFRTHVCNESGSYIDCGPKLVVHVQSAADWVNIDPVSCLTAGELTPQSGNDSDSLTASSGGAGQVVLVTACYDWDLGGDMWQNFWNLLTIGAWSNGDAAKEGGKVIVQTVTTFRTEPYE